MTDNLVNSIKLMMDDCELDVILIQNSNRIRLITHCDVFSGVLIISQKSVDLFVDKSFAAIQLKENNSVIFHVAETTIWYEAILWLSRYSAVKIGIDPFDSNYGFCQLMQSVIDSEIVDIGEELAIICSQKPVDIIKKIEKSVLATKSAIENTLRFVKTGVSEKKLAQMLNIELMRQTGEIPAFETMVAFGENTIFPHWKSNKTILREGDTILIDCGASIDGVKADLTRTFFWKYSTDEKLRCYHALRNAFRNMIQGLTINQTGESIIKKFLSSKEMRPYASDCFDWFGHGIGFALHEYPTFSMESKDALMQNMTFCLEPGVYKPELGGIRIEEVIWLSHEGPVVFGDDVRKDPVLQEENHV